MPYVLAFALTMITAAFTLPRTSGKYIRACSTVMAIRAYSPIRRTIDHIVPLPVVRSRRLLRLVHLGQCPWIFSCTLSLPADRGLGDELCFLAAPQPTYRDTLLQRTRRTFHSSRKRLVNKNDDTAKEGEDACRWSGRRLEAG